MSAKACPVVIHQIGNVVKVKLALKNIYNGIFYLELFRLTTSQQCVTCRCVSAREMLFRVIKPESNTF